MKQNILSTAIFLFIFLGIGISSTSAFAQAKCGERNSIVSILDDKYAEKPVATGLTQGGGVVEVFAASDGDWTMIVTLPTGLACFMAAGEGWENFPKLAGHKI